MTVQASYGAASMATAMNKQMFGAEVVTQTLNNMNQQQNSYGSQSSYNADYDFQKSVLSAAYTGKGGMLNITV